MYFVRKQLRLALRCFVACFIIHTLGLTNLLKIDKARIFNSVESLLWRRWWWWNWDRLRQRLNQADFIKYLRSFLLENFAKVIVHVGIITFRYCRHFNCAIL